MNNPVFNALGGAPIANPVDQVMQQINALKQQYSNPQAAIMQLMNSGQYSQRDLDAAQAAAQQFMKQYLNK